MVDWDLFKSRWASFKATSDIDADKVVHQLLGSLETYLQRLLYRENNKPEALTEGDHLELLQQIAMKTENVWCLRENLHNMMQDTGEPVTGFAARLKGQARLCQYTLTCSCGCNVRNDFTDTVVMGDLVRGLSDLEIKTLILSEVEQKADLPSSPS